MLRNVGLRKSVEQPVLDLNFAASQIGSNGAPDSRIDFSRGNNAWFVDSDGLVKKSPHNLGLYSEDFTQWTATAGVVTANQIAAPDGSLTADLLADDGTASTHRFSRLIGGNTIGETMFASIYVKATSDSSDISWREDKEDALSVTFNPTTGQITGGTGTAEDVGNGWYRLTITGALASQTVWSTEIRFSGTPASVYVWGAQVSQHTTLPVGNPYVKTEASAVYAARLDHDPSWFMSAAQEQNLISYSEELGSNTLTGPNRTISDNAGTDPNGTSTASQVTATGADPYVVITNLPEVGPATFTLSVYLRGDPANTGTDLKLRIQDSGSGLQTSSVQTITSEWQRFEFSATTTGILESVRLDIPDVADSGDIVFVWGLQLEVGSTASTYHRTEGQPYYGPGATPKGLLIEEQRANLLQGSNDLSLFDGFAGNMENEQGAALGPDGTTTAVKFKATSTSLSNPRVFYPTSGVTLTAADYTYSIFLKKGEFSWAKVRLDISGSFDGVFFDLDNGTVGTASSGFTGKIIDYGNGWFRCSITVTATAAVYFAGVHPATADNTVATSATVGDGLFMWGHSLELGSFPTSYIENISDAAGTTRNADVAVMGPTTGGTELVSDPSFDSGVGQWIATTNATVSHDASNLDVEIAASNASGAFMARYRVHDEATIIEGRRYRITLDATRDAGSANYVVRAYGDESFTDQLAVSDTSTGASASFIIDCTATSSEQLEIVFSRTGTRSLSDAFSLDNLSVRELYPFEQYNPAEGTVLFEASVPAGMSNFTSFFNIADDGSYDDRITIINNGTDSEAYTQVRSGGTILLNTFNDAVSYTLGQKFRVAVAYAASDFASTIDATTVRTATSGAVPAMDSIKIGLDANDSNHGSFHARRARIFPKRLPDSILQSLTSD